MIRALVPSFTLMLTLVLSCALMLMTGCVPASLGEPVSGADPASGYGKWRYGDIHSADSPPATMALHMIGLLREGTHGRIDIDYYPNGQLGDLDSLVEEIRVGTVDIGVTSANYAYDPRFLIDWTPYRFFTWEQAYEAYQPGGWCLEILEDIFVDNNIKLLGYGLTGFTGLSLSMCPDRLPPESVGIRIRTPAIACWKSTWEVMGYLPTVIPVAETYTAMRTGVIQGQAGGTGYACASIGDIQRCWIQTNDWMEVQPIGMNLHLWNSLTSRDQSILRDVVTTCLWAPGGFNDRQRELEAIARERAVLDFGIEFIVLDEARLAECVRAVRTEVWPYLEPYLGSHIYGVMRANCAPIVAGCDNGNGRGVFNEAGGSTSP